MGRKILVIALAAFAFGFGSAMRSNAGTEVIEPYRAPAPRYNYAPPPPRPIVYAPLLPVFGVVIGPRYGYYGRGYGYYGRGYYGGQRFYGRHWHSHHHWR